MRNSKEVQQTVEAFSEAFAACDMVSEIEAAEGLLSSIAKGNERVAALMASTFLAYLKDRRARS